MKIFAFNDKLDNPSEHGSFTVVSRKLNEQFCKLGVLGDPKDPECFVIYCEVFDTAQKWQRHIPYLACEYSMTPTVVIHKLNYYKPLVLSISEFAKHNLINSGYHNVKAIHLGTSPDCWFKTDDAKFDTFTYLTVNTSNERSGYESLIPSFIEFSKNKNVKLIIKDQENTAFRKFIEKLNCNKIEYIGKPFSEEELRVLYNKSHLFIYANNTTSFGMNAMDSVLCGTPCITTYGSALKEFIPEWSQPIKIRTEMKCLDENSIKEWTKIGINCFPPDFLNFFSGKIYGERVLKEDILEALEYSYYNYKEYLSIASRHKQFILENYTWEKCANKIIEKLNNYV